LLSAALEPLVAAAELGVGYAAGAGLIATDELLGAAVCGLLAGGEHAAREQAEGEDRTGEEIGKHGHSPEIEIDN
jgi:hypothetical protein